MHLMPLRCIVENVWSGTFSVYLIMIKINVGLEEDSLVVQYVLLHI